MLKILERVRRLTKRLFPECSLIVYGSHALGTATAASDLDLIMVCGKKGIPELTPANLKKLLSKALFVEKKHIERLLEGKVDCLALKDYETNIAMHVYEKNNFCRLVSGKTGIINRVLIVRKKIAINEKLKMLDYSGKAIPVPLSIMGKDILVLPGKKSDCESFLVQNLLGSKVVLDGAGIKNFLENKVFSQAVLNFLNYNNLLEKKNSLVFGFKKRAFEKNNILKMVFLKNKKIAIPAAVRRRLQKKYSGFVKKTAVRLENRPETISSLFFF